MSETKSDHQCPVCGSSDKAHKQENEHGFTVVSGPGELLAFVINLKWCADSAAGKAINLALARAEMKKYFPGKQFEIQPSEYKLTKYGESSVLLGQAHVTTYSVFEV